MPIDTSYHITVSQVRTVYDYSVGLLETVCYHIPKSPLRIIRGEAFVLVPFAIDEQIRALSLILGSHERMVDILVDELLRSGHPGRKPYLLALPGKEICHLHQFLIVAIGRIYQLMYLHLAFVRILLLGLEPLALALADELACCAQLILRNEGENLTPSLSQGEGGFSLCQVAVVAPAYGIGIVVRYGFLLLPGIEAEESLRVAL